MPATYSREIHSRDSDGITVTLYALFAGSECIEIYCRVIDTKRGEDFTIRDIPRNRALEAFYHPFAFGNRALMAGAV
jgi:hypothetical protein